ncbi:uncharacterized protein P174DRAFT_487683 [Aspergillus novofumigatus IBT 16806]|uniref:Uncharacterized protein n=1 Tax=Aspergillus novofumigatus (strain IBT 16806) TaxID=1392255 RepID=A0A2I1C3W0_ASPN1|nr:uncharacterized protein P174DRAFT_487683 [Aspergillus novofumigatus IBT 16806]PKX92283.1 hypothetical protein P174DRAFT_487683 [Aspergillus novofumigatus IBT 16806]
MATVSYRLLASFASAPLFTILPIHFPYFLPAAIIFSTAATNSGSSPRAGTYPRSDCARSLGPIKTISTPGTAQISSTFSTPALVSIWIIVRIVSFAETIYSGVVNPCPIAGNAEPWPRTPCGETSTRQRPV